MTKLQGFFVAVFALVLSGPLPDEGQAQTASGRTVRIIVPFPPGGTADILARVLGEQIGKTGGPTILVENRPGGGTVIATDQVARSAPDGNTLLLMANSFVINAAVRPSLPYDPLTSFEPVCLMVDSPQIMVVNATSPFKTLAEFVAAAKAKPGELNYATVGPATTQHIAFEMFNRAAGIKLTYVPYGGGAPATTALVGGHVMAVLANPSEVMEQVKADKLRAIAVASRERFAPLPSVPTIAGILSGLRSNRLVRTGGAGQDAEAGHRAAYRHVQDGARRARRAEQARAARLPLDRNLRRRVRRAYQGAACRLQSRDQGSRHQGRLKSEAL